MSIVGMLFVVSLYEIESWKYCVGSDRISQDIASVNRRQTFNKA